MNKRGTLVPRLLQQASDSSIPDRCAIDGGAEWIPDMLDRNSFALDDSPKRAA